MEVLQVPSHVHQVMLLQCVIQVICVYWGSLLCTVAVLHVPLCSCSNPTCANEI